jgi:hypothetical protein
MRDLVLDSPRAPDIASVREALAAETPGDVGALDQAQLEGIARDCQHATRFVGQCPQSNDLAAIRR